MDEVIIRKIEMTKEEFEEKLGLKGITEADIDTGTCSNTLVFAEVSYGAKVSTIKKCKEIITFTVKERKEL